MKTTSEKNHIEKSNPSTIFKPLSSIHLMDPKINIKTVTPKKIAKIQFATISNFGFYPILYVLSIVSK